MLAAFKIVLCFLDISDKKRFLSSKVLTFSFFISYKICLTEKLFNSLFFLIISDRYPRIDIHG